MPSATRPALESVAAPAGVGQRNVPGRPPPRRVYHTVHLRAVHTTCGAQWTVHDTPHDSAHTRVESRVSRVRTALFEPSATRARAQPRPAGPAGARARTPVGHAPTAAPRRGGAGAATATLPRTFITVAVRDRTCVVGLDALRPPSDAIITENAIFSSVDLLSSRFIRIIVCRRVPAGPAGGAARPVPGRLASDGPATPSAPTHDDGAPGSPRLGPLGSRLSTRHVTTTTTPHL